MDNLSFELETLIFETCTFLRAKQINSRPWYHSRPYKSRTLNFRRQKLSNFPLTSKYLAPESLALRYSCFTPATWTEKGCFGNSIVFPSLPPTFFPRAPPLPLPDPPPNHAKPPNLVLRRSRGPHTPPDLPSAPWNPQLPTHHCTGAASAMATAGPNSTATRAPSTILSYQVWQRYPYAAENQVLLSNGRRLRLVS